MNRRPFHLNNHICYCPPHPPQNKNKNPTFINMILISQTALTAPSTHDWYPLQLETDIVYIARCASGLYKGRKKNPVCGIVGTENPNCSYLLLSLLPTSTDPTVMDQSFSRFIL